MWLESISLFELAPSRRTSSPSALADRGLWLLNGQSTDNSPHGTAISEHILVACLVDAWMGAKTPRARDIFACGSSDTVPNRTR